MGQGCANLIYRDEMHIDLNTLAVVNPVALQDLTEILESRLPIEFGGGPCDYQLVEEEGPGGQTRLTLRIHPRLSELDETRIIARFMDELGRTDRSVRFMTEVWRKSGTVRVTRETPRTSLRGKTISVHLAVAKG